MVIVAVHKGDIRCTLLGDGMVGKTCLAKSFTGQGFPQRYIATVQESYSGSTYMDGAKYNMQLNDIAGEHEDDCSNAKTYKETDVFVLCYSVVDRESFDSIREFWVPEIHNKAKKRPIILVATQTDLRKQGKLDHLTKVEGEILAKQIGAESFIECSAFNKEGINYVFKNVISSALKQNKSKCMFRKVFTR